MEMKPSEILQSYENAQYKTKQIGVQAELNACSKDEITDILKEMGAELPKRKYQKKEEPAKEPEKKEWEVYKKGMDDRKPHCKVEGGSRT